MAINVKSFVTGQAKGTKWQTLTDKFHRNVALTATNAGIRREIIKKQKGEDFLLIFSSVSFY